MPCHQSRLDSLQLDVQPVELAGQHADHLARQHRHALIARQALKQLGHLLGSFGHGDAELRRMPADRVDQHRALLDQQVPHSEHRQRRLLLGVLDRHKPHGRPAHRLADRLGVDLVILAALDVRLDVLRREQHHLVPQAAQHPRPVVRGATRLEPDSGWRQLGKDFCHFAAPDLSPHPRLLVLINPMNLKDMFGRVETNSDNRHPDGSLGCVVTTSQPGTLDAVGGRPPQQGFQSLAPLFVPGAGSGFPAFAGTTG